MTPDTIPPVFSSVSITPEMVKNGDTFDITADLGETHLFVSAIISSVDSSRTGTILLLDEGDGTYHREVPINWWNEAEDGLKTISLTATDFWGNTTSSQGEIMLQNPAPALDAVPPDDTFDGIRLDHNKWQTDTFGGGMVLQDNRLVAKTGDIEPSSGAGIHTTWQFSGDFDVQVYFQISTGWGLPATDHLDGAAFGVSIDGENYHMTRLRNASGDDLIFSWWSAGILVGEANSSALTGRYRRIRQGTTLTLLCDVGRGWMKIVSISVPTSPAMVYMDNASVGASQAFTTYFDDFHINSGPTTYRLKTYLPSIQR